MKARVRVLAAGWLTTVQDQGRWGWQDRGIPVAGPMDPWSFRAAQALVGNTVHEAAFELTLVGPSLQFTESARFALVGGSWEATLGDGSPVRADRSYDVRPGTILQVGRAQSGARGYVACAGGLDVPAVCGSRSTHVRSAMGGVEGRALRAGDEIPLGPRIRAPRVFRPSAWPNSQPGVPRVRILPGPHADSFAHALDTFVSATWRIMPQSDRMGYRLEGPSLSRTVDADIISEAVTMGTVQVPRSGQPIVLMADRPTTGGYPKIGTVIRADLGVLAQLAPGDALQFAWCSRQEAVAALLARERAFL